MVITGNFLFIENKHLRNLIIIRLDFREVRTINWNGSRSGIGKGIEDSSQRLSSSNNNIQVNDMTAWKNEKMLHVENKINNLKQKVNPMLQRVDVMEYLKKSKQDLPWFQFTKQQITSPLFVSATTLR